VNILGIYPGVSGGLAFVGDDEIACTKMPATEGDLWLLLSTMAEHVDVCYVEHVHSMHGEGVRSAFTFGYGYGGVRMALIAAEIRTELVAPHTWCKAHGLRRDKDETNVSWKNRHKALAQRKFPHIKVTHHIADALLIADYGRYTEAP
jgi:hypothetical protein